MTKHLARAKINLALHVTGQRADGYHLLDSLVCFADFGDELCANPSESLSLSVVGPMAKNVPDGADNLVLRAACLLDPSLGAAIELTKRLPMAAGIGGGSSDAAACLTALSKLWDVPLPDAADVLTLGADVPVCLAGETARMRGIGDEITPVNMPALQAVLVHPGIGLSTPQVFSQLKNKSNAPLGAVPTSNSFAEWCEFLTAARNDLEAPAVACAPIVAEVLAELVRVKSCALARMSGSGSTCFGLFKTKQEAEKTAETLKISHPNWWIKAVTLG